MESVVFSIKFWVIFGGVLIVAEFIVPGLVSVFLGMGAFVVAGLIHYGYINNVSHQILAWIISSLLFIFTLRFLVMYYYPSDTFKGNTDEDSQVFGERVLVVKDIAKDEPGRVKHSDSTWPAVCENGEAIKVGEMVEIVSRDNLTWVVRKI
jgi:inner membrane protein